MSCPNCGSTRRREIAPGFVECDGTVQVDHPAPVPGGRYLYDEPCRTRYQIGTGSGAANGVCACGTFAVRRCRSCDEPVCGDRGCSSAVSVAGAKQWWCRNCVRAAKEREQRARLAPIEAEYARVRALPRGGVQELHALYRGDPGVEDGRTHQFLDLTNQEMAEFVFGVTGGAYAPYVEFPSADFRVYRDGTRRHVHEARPNYSVDGDNRYNPAVDKLIGGPADLFNPQPLIDDPEFPAQLRQRGHGHPYSPLDETFRQFRDLQMSRAAERRVEQEHRSGQTARLIACLLLAVAAIACVVSGVTVLRTATNTQEQNPSVLLFLAAVVLAAIAVTVGSSWATRR